jgi:hypothetical protein
MRLPEDEHEEVQALIAWYVTGALDGGDRARFEEHLAACARCRAELAAERRLAAEVADLPLGVEQGWADLVSRIEQRTAPVRRRAPPPRLGWALAAAGVGLAVVIAGLAQPLWLPAPLYRGLGARGTGGPGNIVAMFKPDARAAQLNTALASADARIVDGPTPAGAYLLRTPAANRATALARLRARPEIELAEPVDAPSPP